MLHPRKKYSHVQRVESKLRKMQILKKPQYVEFTRYIANKITSLGRVGPIRLYNYFLNANYLFTKADANSMDSVLL